MFKPVFIYSLLISSVLLTASVKAFDDKADFKAAYAAYNQALENRLDVHDVFEAAQKAYKSGQKVFADDSLSLAALGINYANAWVADRGEEAVTNEIIAVIKNSFEIQKKKYVKGDARFIDTYLAMGNVYNKSNDYSKMKSALMDMVHMLEKEDPTHKLIFEAYNTIGGNYYGSFIETGKAEKYFRKAAAFAEKYYPENGEMNGISNFWLGKAALTKKKRDTAEKYFNIAIEKLKEGSAQYQDLILKARGFLINIYMSRGEDDKVNEHCRAIGLARKSETVDGEKPLFRLSPQLDNFHEGYTTLKFSVTENGAVKDLQVVESTSDALSRASIKAIEKWRYAPAVKDGKLVETKEVFQRFTFSYAK